MRPVSQNFLDALRGSHKMFARATVLSGYQTGVQPVGGVEIPIFSGTVSSDAKADIRSSIDIVTNGNGMFPIQTNDLIAPYGNELFVERGLELADGTREVVSQGYFRIYNVEQVNAPKGSLRVQGYDRMSGIIDARLLIPVTLNPGFLIGDIFTALVRDVYPNAELEFDDTEFPNTALSTVQVVEEDRFDFLFNLARSYGKIMYWDYRGILVIRTPPDVNATVWEVNAGRDGVLMQLARTRNREGVYNAVVALGESVNDNPPVRAIAYDNNSNSPTYFFGRFGKVPRFFSSSFITTEDQAATAARNMLKQVIGLPQSMSFTTVANPALEPLDPVLVFDLTENTIQVVETLNIGLTAKDPMTATTRRQITFSLGV